MPPGSRRCWRPPTVPSMWLRPEPGLRATEIATPEGAQARGSTGRVRSRNTLARRVMAGVAVAGVASVGLVATGGAQDFLSLFQPSQLAASPGDGCRRPFPRRACQLRHRDRWLIASRSAPNRTPPRPALRPVSPPLWWRISPRGRRAPKYAVVSGGGRHLHLRRRPGAGGRGPGRWAAARDALRARRAARCRCRSRPRWWSRTASTPRALLNGGGRAFGGRRSSSWPPEPRLCPRPA